MRVELSAMWRDIITLRRLANALADVDKTSSNLLKELDGSLTATYHTLYKQTEDLEGKK